MRIKILTIALVLTASVALHAATAFNVTGPSPFTISGEIADVLSFTLANPYTNVTITMPFADITGGGPIGGTEGTVFLTNQIGAGTTVANQIAVPVTISGLSAAFSTRTLFTGLTLPAGTYFVVVARTTTFSLVVQGSSTPTVTVGTGVTDHGDGDAFSLNAFPPASTFIPNPLQLPTNVFITVTGDAGAPTPTPLPSSLILLLTGMLGVGLFAARHKFAGHGELAQ